MQQKKTDLIPMAKVPELTGYCMNSVYVYTQKKFITVVKIGSKAFVSTSDVQKLKQRHDEHTTNTVKKVEGMTSFIEAANILKYHVNSLHKLAQQGVVEKIRIDGHVYLSQDDMVSLKNRYDVLHGVDVLDASSRKKAFKKRSATKQRKKWVGIPDELCPTYIVLRRKKDREKYYKRKETMQETMRVKAAMRYAITKNKKPLTVAQRIEINKVVEKLGLDQPKPPSVFTSAAFTHKQ